MHMAACNRPRIVEFLAESQTFAKITGRARSIHGNSVKVPCAPVGSVLELLGVHHVDFASIDVEGSELAVLRSLVHSNISIGVALIEVCCADAFSPGVRLS